jgi:hypothetical protein
MYLYEIAHSRAGDKGDVSNISLIAYHQDFYPILVREVTAARVSVHFDGIVGGRVERYELPLIGALNFVLHDALGGGVTRSLNLDAHGKSLSSLLLAMEIPGLAAGAKSLGDGRHASRGNDKSMME